MNSLIADEFPLRDTQSLRYDLMERLTDADLAYRLPGDNPTLGELCREIGEIEQAYIQSFTTFAFDLSYRHPEPDIASSVERLKKWYTALDDEFEDVIRGFSEEDLHSKQIDRGRYAASLFVQFQIYREALLIFFAKVIVYLKAMQKSISEQWQWAIG